MPNGYLTEAEAWREIADSIARDLHTKQGVWVQEGLYGEVGVLYGDHRAIDGETYRTMRFRLIAHLWDVITNPHNVARNVSVRDADTCVTRALFLAHEAEDESKQP